MKEEQVSTTLPDRDRCHSRNEAVLDASGWLAVHRAVTALRSDGLDDRAARGAALDILGQLIAVPCDTDHGGGGTRGASLSGRERDVLECLVDGSSNREIGQQLYIAESTVRFHVSHILRKLGTRTRAEVIALVLNQRRFDYPVY